MRISMNLIFKTWILYLVCLLSHPIYAIAETCKDKFINWPSWAFYLYKHPGYKDYKPPENITKYGCKWGAWVTFPQKIEAIQAKVRNISNPANLLLSKDFLAMYKHPVYYYKAILDYLIDKTYTLEQKTIALYIDQPSLEQAYKLYKEKKINSTLLSLICAISFSKRFESNCSLTNQPKNLYWETEKPLLEQMLKELPKHMPLYKALQSVFNQVFPKTWEKYLMSTGEYYRQHCCLPFQNIIFDALREKKQFEKWLDGTLPEYLLGPEYPPYFLMVLEHPRYYYPAHFGPFSGRDYYDCGAMDGIGMLQELDYLEEEKALAIFGMSQFGILTPYESKNYYAVLIENACDWYKQGALSVKNLYRLFVCDFPTFYKYPFFILDYKDENVQRALDKLIGLPMIPCGLKDLAQKVKNGTLATKQEIEDMEGYRTFRKTYFTLYETVPPRK